MRPRSYLAAGRDSFPAAHSSEVAPRFSGGRERRTGRRLRWGRSIRPLQANDVARAVHADSLPRGSNEFRKRRGVVSVKLAAHLLHAERRINDDLDAITEIELLGCRGHGIVVEYEPAIGPGELAHGIDLLDCRRPIA